MFFLFWDLRVKVGTIASAKRSAKHRSKAFVFLNKYGTDRNIDPRNYP